MQITIQSRKFSPEQLSKLATARCGIYMRDFCPAVEKCTKTWWIDYLCIGFHLLVFHIQVKLSYEENSLLHIYRNNNKKIKIKITKYKFENWRLDSSESAWNDRKHRINHTYTGIHLSGITVVSLTSQVYNQYFPKVFIKPNQLNL